MFNVKNDAMRRTILALAATLLFTLSGCSIYHPQAVDIPLINHAGDGRIDAAIGVSTFILPDVVTFGGTVSYGFNDWFAGQAHLNYGGDNIYAQVAPGAYLPLGAKSVLEGYVGLGAGSSWRAPTQASTEVDTATHQFSKYGYTGFFLLPYMQANIGWHDLTRAHIDLALGLKAGAYCPDFRYQEFDENGTHIANSDVFYGTPNFLFEPQVQFRIGSEHVKYCLRVSMTWLSDLNIGGGEKFTTDFFTVSNGLTFKF